MVKPHVRRCYRKAKVRPLEVEGYVFMFIGVVSGLVLDFEDYSPSTSSPRADKIMVP